MPEHRVGKNMLQICMIRSYSLRLPVRSVREYPGTPTGLPDPARIATHPKILGKLLAKMPDPKDIEGNGTAV